MPINQKHIAISALLVILTFPEWYPEFNIGIDPSCAWLYNYLLVEQPYTLSQLIFPHGPLDFLQSPLPMGYNLEIAIIFDLILRLIFCWSGLQLVSTVSKKRFWTQVLLLALGLVLNRMDILLFATTAQFVLLAITTKNTTLLFPAALLSVVGLLTKTAIGMPGTMMLGSAVLYLLSKRKEAGKLLAVIATLPAFAAVIWVALIGNMDGFIRMIQGTLYLIQGNSSAVCHYPPNNWMLLGAFWLSWFSWPIVAGVEKRDRLHWSLLSIPLFAFWKYGISREDIWHLYTTYRALLWMVGTMVVLNTNWKLKNVALVFLTLGSFYLNLRRAEGFVHFAVKPIGVKRFYDWTAHLKNKKLDAIEKSEKNLASQKLPDSIRNYIGNKTVDIFPWHYTYAAVNHLNLQPRHIPQSYAAYHPWLDQLDARFFSSENAPDIILFHLKPLSAMGQFMGIDDRYLLQDAPKTMLALANHYKVQFRHPNYLILERSEKTYLSQTQTFKYQDGWRPPQGKTGIALLKIPLKQSLTGRLKSIVYKTDPVLADVHLQHTQRRIKLVPSLAMEGIWMAPWMEEVTTGNERYQLPDSIQLVPHNKNWSTNKSDWQIDWIEINPESGLIPTYKKSVDNNLQKIGEISSQTIPKNSFSNNWVYTYTRDSSQLKSQEFELKAFIQSPLNAGCCHLVWSTYDQNGNEIHYQSTEYCSMGIGADTAWPVSLKVSLPTTLPTSFTVKAYVWNSGTKEIKLNGLEIWTNYQ